MSDIEHSWIFDAGRDDFSDNSYVTQYTLAATSPANGDDMVGGATYLIICQFQFAHNSTTDHIYWKLRHDTTDFAESEERWEWVVTAASYGKAIGYATIFTQPGSPEDIELQFKTDDTTDPVIRIRNVTITAIRLDADLTLNTDYWVNEDDDLSTPTDLVSDTPTTFASQTLTTVANATYLIIGYARTKVNNVSRSYKWELSVAGTITARDSLEGENTAEMRGSFLIGSFVEGGSGQSRTFALEGTHIGDGVEHAHAFSRIIAVKLTGNFTDFARQENIGTVARDDVAPVLLANLDPTLTTAQDVLLFASAVDDADTVAFRSSSRIQESGVDIVDNIDNFARHATLYDNRDEPWFGFVVMDPAQSGTPDYDFDAEAQQTTGNWQYRNFIMWGMELDAGGQFLRPDSDDDVGGWEPDPSSPTTLFDKIDEVTPSDTDFISEL